MKKLLCMWLAVCGLLLIPGNMKGQSLKDILNSSAVKNAVTSVTGGKAVTFENLQGTWMYVSPALQLEGDNALKNVAGSLAELDAKIDEIRQKEETAKNLFRDFAFEIHELEEQLEEDKSESRYRGRCI